MHHGKDRDGGQQRYCKQSAHRNASGGRQKRHTVPSEGEKQERSDRDGKVRLVRVKPECGEVKRQREEKLAP